MDEKEAKNWKGSEIKRVKYFTRTLDSNCSRNRVTPNVVIPHPSTQENGNCPGHANLLKLSQ